MTSQMEELDRLIDALNTGGSPPVIELDDPELAGLLDAVVRIRRVRAADLPDTDWPSQAVAELARELGPHKMTASDRAHHENGWDRENGDVVPEPPRSLAELTNETRPRRGHVTRQLAQMAAAILVLVLVTGLLAIVFGIQSNSNKSGISTGKTTVAVPDTLLGTEFDSGSKTYSLWAYLPGGNAFQPVLDVGSQPVISPDGRQLFSGQVTQENDVVHIAVVALSSSTLNRQWSTEIVSFPASKISAGNLASAGASIAVSSKRVYVIPEVWNTRDPITTVVLDRQSGDEVARWSIQREGPNAASGVFIYAAPDGSSLYLLDLTIDSTGMQSTPPIYLRVSTIDGHVDDRHELTSDGQRYFPTGRLTPDGNMLYSVGGWLPSSNGRVELQFFDLASGQLEPSVELPFQSNAETLDREEATSPDGRTLYVLSPTAKELAIIDLLSRTVTKVVPIEGLAARNHSIINRIAGTIRGWLVQPAAAKFYFSGDMQLSPDGKRLYAVSVSGSGYEAIPSGVIAIDTTTWQVIDHWLPDSQINYLQLGSDGHSLYVQTSDSSGQTNLTLLDTRTGVASSIAGDIPGYVQSLAQLYQQRYGKLPAASGSGAVPSAPLARLDVTVNHSNILSGDTVSVDARFVDPSSDKLVQSGQTSVRFEPPAQVIATFYHGQIGPGDVSVQLGQVGYGHYRGSAVLTDPTVWTLQIDATRDNAPGSRAEITNAVVVQTALMATDGRRYTFKLTTDPTQPRLGKATTVRVALVEAESGSPMPNGVELTRGSPATVEAAFFRGTPATGQASEMMSVTLRPADDGSYEGTITLDASGSWTVQINFSRGGHAISTLAGSIEVTTP